MKLFTGLLVLAFVALGAHSQEDTLMSVQDELAHTHLFFETIMGINRGQLSAYIYRITRSVINNHLDTFERIATSGSAARDHINSLVGANEAEENCLVRWRNRFELQTQRIGQRLARCAGIVSAQLGEWNSYVNEAHRLGQLKAAQIQNLGISTLANQRLFDGPENFPAMIKSEFRDRVFLALNTVRGVEDFIEDISSRITQLENDLVQCDRDVEIDADREIALEVSGAEACVGGGSPVDPTPTSLLQ